MFKFVRKHSQPIGDHPLTDTLFLYIAWKYKPSQTIGDHPLWPCQLRVVSNFVRHSYVCLYTYIYTYVYTVNIHIYIYIYLLHIQTHTHTFIKSIQSLFLLRVGTALKPRFFPEGPGGFCHRRPCAQRCHDWLRDFEVRGAVGGGLGHGKAPPGAVE